MCVCSVLRTVPSAWFMERPKKERKMQKHFGERVQPKVNKEYNFGTG